MRTFDDVVPGAVDLARAWTHAAHAGALSSRERRATRRLARLVADPEGLELALRFVDRVARPRDPAVAARELARLRGTHGAFLSAVDRTMLGAGALVAPSAPRAVVPVARARLRQLVGHLVADDGPGLGALVARLQAEGFRVNVNLLGEAVLGEGQARARATRLLSLVRRPDIDYVSVKTSSVVPQISTWDTTGARDRVLRRLRPLARSATADGTFLNLDMEEYRDLELTLQVFEELADDPGLADLSIGVALQAYLPDAHDALDRVVRLARRRAMHGGRPVKVRLVKGANLAMEHVEAELHGWVPATYQSKADVDASYLALVDRALDPRLRGALRVGVASHNLFHVAAAHVLATERGVARQMDIEMLHGMAPNASRAVLATTGDVLLYLPVVAPEDFDVAIGYLVRRLEENAAEQNFLRATTGPPAAMAAQEEAFLAAVGHRGAVSREPRRLAALRAAASDAQGHREPGHLAEPGTSAEPDDDAESVRGEARHEAGAPSDASDGHPPDAGRHAAPGSPEPEFANAPDSDPALARTRTWAATLRDPTTDALLLARAPVPTFLTTRVDVDTVLDRARAVRPAWAAADPDVRANVLLDAAERLEALRGDLVATAVHEVGKTVAEADPEVSEAVDFARYYAGSARELAGDPDATFTPGGVTLVTPPWNFPVAIPCGSVLAALAAGSTVVLKPSHLAPRCALVAASAIRDALAHAGFAADVLQVVEATSAELGRALVAHRGVARVVLTGSIDTARAFVRWNPGADVLAETSGKNAMVVTPSADVDLAVADTVRSAFGHAGQKCSAASLLILVGSAGTDQRLRRQLADAVESLVVGPATEAASVMGPLTAPASGKLWHALTRLDPGETWLVAPRALDAVGRPQEGTSRLWTPGVRAGVRPGSWFHHTEVFGPVLGVIRVDTLDEAIDVQNAVAFGLTAGLHSLDEEEIARWTARVQAGNLYVNRHTTGAIVRRQPFGGWKESSVGPGAKAGGPHYVAQLGTWADADAVPDRVAEPEAWLARAGASDDRAWRERFARAHDPSGLAVERNELRYVPVDHLDVRVGPGALAVELRRVLAAAHRAGVPVTVSVDPGWGLPPDAEHEDDDALVADVRAQAGAGAGGADAGGAGGAGAAGGAVDVVVETAEQVLQRVRDGAVAGRVRALGSTPGLRAAAAPWAGRTTVLDAPVVASGRRELLTVVREQAVSTTVHRYGHVPVTART